ncbi:MAG: recombinase family protein [Alphaproteobacteria bacterium]|nr:recombinase family protein [Alphaproteobacteria bacterium]
MKTPKAQKSAVSKVRCAIYTRKSSEEGLDMEFNSLDAQREACAAYIASQKAEGWLELPERYDDGGFSGGTLERPALKRLLTDIQNNRVDVVVVYKIDRLSRALMDFAKLVDVFDAHKVTFVSITQSFNTTTSMGRLTLNILLSFAQFEREVIGERIRDKFAASRRKGMWMGGNPPLGYDVVNRKLVVNEPEAELVRLIFRRFVELGSVGDLMRELAAAGHRAKSWTTQDGKERKGGPIDRQALYGYFANRVYLGEAVHKGVAYPGEHEAIIDRDTWGRVHTIISDNTRARGPKPRTESPALLKGLLYGPAGTAMTPTYTRKNGKIYRYYVSQTALRTSYGACALSTVPAGEIESTVIAQLRTLLRTPEIIVRTWKQAANDGDRLPESEVTAALRSLDPLWDQLFPAEQSRLVRLLIARATIDTDGVRIDLRTDGLATLATDLRPTLALSE